MGTFERHHFSDQLNIDTPEQVELAYSIAGIGSRFVAILLDKILLFVVCVVLFIAALLFFGSLARMGDRLDNASNWFIAGLVLIVFLITWGYFALFEAFWNGQTPGKRVMKLRVIKDSGRQITFFESLARNLLRFIDYMPGLYLVGVITMICNKRNKRLGDFVAGTIVVHERLDEQPLLVMAGPMLTPRFNVATPQNEPWQQSVPALFPADATAKLGPKDLVLIEAFFARALDLTVEMRATMAGRIAGQMAAKMGVAMPEGNPERALESIAFAMRGSGRSIS